MIARVALSCCLSSPSSVRNKLSTESNGRLTGRPGVCLATLGPGATNLITGVADANMDRAPLVAIAGQGSTHRMHKESHQILDAESFGARGFRVESAEQLRAVLEEALDCGTVAVDDCRVDYT